MIDLSKYSYLDYRFLLQEINYYICQFSKRNEFEIVIYNLRCYYYIRCFTIDYNSPYDIYSYYKFTLHEIFISSLLDNILNLL